MRRNIVDWQAKIGIITAIFLDKTVPFLHCPTNHKKLWPTFRWATAALGFNLIPNESYRSKPITAYLFLVKTVIVPVVVTVAPAAFFTM